MLFDFVYKYWYTDNIVPGGYMKYKVLSMSLISIILSITIVSSFAVNRQAIEAAGVTIITEKSTEQYITTYYNGISSSQSGLQLAASLENLLQGERGSSFSYKSLQSSAFPYTDVDPNRPNEGYIVSFYSGTPVKGYSGMNKEHTWPNSHGGGKIDHDPHVIRPTLTSENSARGNSYFAESSSQGWDPDSFGNEKYRGIAARIILYGAVIGYSEGLRLEDVGFVSGDGNGGKMGKLSDLLKWNLQYPIDTTEIIRNETLDKSLNYNRNPFIDNPDYACRIWGGTNSNTQNICAASNVAPDTITLSPSSASINVGSTLNLAVNVSPSNASKTVTWTTSNANVATVNNGVVTPQSVGQTTISARSTIDTSAVGTAIISVTNDPIPVTGVSLDKTSLNLGVGSSATLVETVVPVNASEKRVIWSTSNNEVASVTSQGVVTANRVGSATITVTTIDGGFISSATVTVTEQSQTASIVGSFYNSSSNNDGGDGGVTSENLNNGIYAKNALGFNGEQVVQSVSSSQGYFPRSGGLALGSSSNGGNLTLDLNENYHAIRVEAIFNEAGKGSTVTGITGSSSSQMTSGTPGTAFSKPSTGTPYVVTFSEPADQIVITTSARIALVELTIYYGEEDSSASDAMTWATDFLNSTASGCSQSSKSILQSSWSNLESSYNNLSVNAKEIIVNSAPNETGNAIEEMLARYNHIVAKYGLMDFVGVGYQNSAVSKALNNEMSIAILILIGSTSSVGILIFALMKRRTTAIINKH